MRITLIICLIILVGCVVARKVVPDGKNARVLYEEYKRTYNKFYSNDYDDHLRFTIFEDNLKRAQEYQKTEQGTAKYGVTQFFDLTLEEFRSVYANSRLEGNGNYVNNDLFNYRTPAPASFDWRDHGAVGPVLNQGVCNSGWAFSVIGNIEGQWFRKTGQLLSLSQQQLVDCDEVDNGCQGGNRSFVYDEIERLGGLQLASDYPYTGIQQKCTMDKAGFQAYVNNSVIISKDEAVQAVWLVLLGPLASVFNADVLQIYQSGIMHPLTAACPIDGINHAVLTVGYGDENGIPFWIVKNSWGPKFGENGYFRVYRGKGTCGINELTTSANIK